VVRVSDFRRLIIAASVATVAVALAGQRAQAQSTAVDSAAYRPQIDASTLHPGQFVYAATLERDAVSTNLGTRTFTVSQAMYGGLPTWLLVETRAENGIPATDSVYAGLLALKPIHWTATLGTSRLAAEFRGDTLYGATSAPAGGRSIVTRVPRGMLVSAAMLQTVLELLPLQSNWEDSSMATLSVTPASDTIVPTRISVVGDESVQVPAGTFDCWVVAVHADAARGLYWVSKTDPMVVRSVLDVPTMNGAQLVSTLTTVVR
jgi:hypothetical protein